MGPGGEAAETPQIEPVEPAAQHRQFAAQLPGPFLQFPVPLPFLGQGQQGPDQGGLQRQAFGQYRGPPLFPGGDGIPGILDPGFEQFDLAPGRVRERMLRQDREIRRRPLYLRRRAPRLAPGRGLAPGEGDQEGRHESGRQRVAAKLHAPSLHTRPPRSNLHDSPPLLATL